MALLDPILGWTLALPPFLGVFVMSLVVTLIINLIYKFTTNQIEMKNLKDQIEKFRKQMKENKDNPKKLQKVISEANEVNFRYMGKSLKPTLYTFLPIIFIFAWMNANYTYAPLNAHEPLTITTHFLDGFTGEAVLTSPTLTTNNITSTIVTSSDKKIGSVALFAVTGDPGPHEFTINYQSFSYNGTVWFGEKPTQQLFAGNGPVSTISVDYPRIHPLGPFQLFGWQPGWLALYIVLSVGLSMSTRKLLKIY